MAHCKIEMEKLTVPGFPTTARWTAAATSSSPTVGFRYKSLFIIQSLVMLLLFIKHHDADTDDNDDILR